MEAYNPEKDVVFYDEECDMTTVGGERMFAIFFPFDAHMPGVAINSSDKVKKKLSSRSKYNGKVNQSAEMRSFLMFYSHACVKS